MPKKAEKQYWWFRGVAVDQLRAWLNGVGPECRLEVRLDDEEMTLHVIPESTGPTETGGVVHGSHCYPPACP